jgi:2-polyprenyl-3-methyl-5-hydroxy-6-metoxy-1,4-benzoquinol methylase
MSEANQELVQHTKYIESGAYHRKTLRYPFSPSRLYYDISLKLLGEVLPGERCLDFGGGDGAMATLLANKGAKVTVFDIDELALGFAKTDPRLHQVLGEGLMPFKDAIFQKVTMLEVLEHIPAGFDDFALAECKRVMIPGANIVISVPSTNIERSAAHYRHYTQKDLVKKIESAGFMVNGVIGLKDITPHWALNNTLLRKVTKGVIFGTDFIYRNMNGHFGLLECDEKQATQFILQAKKL